MRPGNQSNKRMRGRGRKGPNPLTRTYESNGPDVKIRGTAMHIAEKYQQLARDAQASGDRVMSENYNQHAEHYLRIVAAAQPQQQPAGLQSGRGEGDEAGAQTAMNGKGAAQSADQGAPEPAAQADVPAVDPDSPQPFIDNMPVIDQEGQVNGAGHSGEEAGDPDADEKPRRRSRAPRARAPRRVQGELAAAPEDASAQAVEGEGGNGAEEQLKPRRRTTRTKRVKPADDVPAEAVAVPSE